MIKIKTVAISQPTYLPWMGYFYLIEQADVYVFLDHVQFEKNSWQSRNRIKGPKGAIWLTVPTHHKGLGSIKDVVIDNTQLWAKKHLLALRACYSKSPFFSDYLPFFESVYNTNWQLLADLNIHITKFLSSQLGISPIFARSSELNVVGKRTDLVLSICKTLKAERYLASIGAEEYMIEDGAQESFTKQSIKVEFAEYTPPVYPQLFGEYVPNLSVIDVLFNCGPDRSRVLLNQGITSLKTLNH